jgi:hypothetical protein
MDPIQYRGAELLIMASTVPLLVYVGYKLFVLGVTGKMQITAGFAKQWTARLTSVAPGTICFLFATVLAVFIVRQALHERPVSAAGTAAPCQNESEDKPTPTLGAAMPHPKGVTQSDNRMQMDFARGKAKDLLSARLEKGLSEYCPLGQNAIRTCSVEFYTHFNMQPSNEDLAHVKELEKKAKAGNVAAKNELSNLAATYLKQ